MSKKVEIDLEVLDQVSGDLQVAMRHEHDHIIEDVRFHVDHPETIAGETKPYYPQHLQDSMQEYFEMNVRWHKLREIIYASERDAEKEA
jgi:hypothetical protein